MKKDELINIWKKGDDLMFRDEKTDKAMITQYINEKTLKGGRSIHFNIIFYWFIQVVNLILLSLNLAGYMNNPAMIWILIPQLLATIGIMVFGIDIFYKLREINNYSESLHSLITRQLKFFKKPYELWLILSSISVLILTINLGLYVDNDNGTYTINHKWVFIFVAMGMLLFIYGTQKLASLFNLHSLKAYLSDLQKGVLEESEKLEQSKKRLIWLYLAIFIILTATLILGILKAIK